jgi:putative redox protein
MITARIGTDRYHTELLASGHHLVADEAASVGGHDDGPPPMEFLMMALASCTAITLRMYADRKQWPLESVEVEVAYERVEATTRLTRTLRLAGALDAMQRERLQQIANACPVHKTLTSPLTIDTVLA